ncbi:hypothetical protein ABZT08_15880 [Streptomyces sp. NPDC005526]|uniref:hypothetical protein n=1 Tax=Streptomyces sp. NPDC005526 TaxID=3156885 RepID=UPI0033AAC652
MTADTFVIDPSARTPDADIWFALPAGFIPLPFKELLKSEEASDGTDIAPRRPQAVPMLHALGDSPRALEFLLPVRRLFQVLAHNGVLHCSLGLHRDDVADGALLPSLFTLGWQEIAWAPRRVTVARIAAGTHDARHAEVLELSCGPASLVVTTLDAPAAGLPRDLLQVAVQIPYPEATKLAVLTLSTPAVHRADHYCDLLRETARMVTFENPFPVNLQGEA